MIVDMQNQDASPRPLPRRRRRSKMQIFKEAYLPAIILAVTAVLITVFILGGILTAQKPQASKPADSSSSLAPEPPASSQNNLDQEAADLLRKANLAAADYDYAKAISILESFNGNISAYPELKTAYTNFQAAKEDLVSWSAADVPNLSFHVLIADPQRAYADKANGANYKRNFITVSEFSAILQELYANGYILVDRDDLYTTEYSTSSGRDIYKEKELLLPSDKKPVMLTEVNASYYTYMVDSNSDGKADAGGDGFASKLCYGENGFYNEYVLSDGTTVTGAYDMVPLLENFIAEHPDFSYRGARATVAFTGYDGILGHRVHSNKLTAAEQLKEKEGAIAVTTALRNAGYTLACYSYGNISYETGTAQQIQTDLNNWNRYVTEVIGAVDTMVFARDSDIAGEEEYAGSKFTLLYNAGFRFFQGVADSPWNQVNDLYVRHDRLMITGSSLTGSAEKYAAYFDAAAVLDPARK